MNLKTAFAVGKIKIFAHYFCNQDIQAAIVKYFFLVLRTNFDSNRYPSEIMGFFEFIVFLDQKIKNYNFLIWKFFNFCFVDF